MRRLPLHPALFIAAWLAIAAASMAAMLAGPPVEEILYAPAVAALLLASVAWTWQAGRFAAGVLAARGRAQLGRRFDLAANILGAVAIMGSVLWVIALPQGLSTTGPTIALLSVALPLLGMGAFALYGIASAALCAAERTVGGGSPHVLGTFIQFVYLVLGAPWLYRRLRRLAISG